MMASVVLQQKHIQDEHRPTLRYLQENLFLNIYRMIQEESALLWEMIV